MGLNIRRVSLDFQNNVCCEEESCTKQKVQKDILVIKNDGYVGHVGGGSTSVTDLWGT